MTKACEETETTGDGDEDGSDEEDGTETMEIARDKRDDLFAGTPPLASLRHLLSSSMSRGSLSWDQKIAVIDVKRAFLHGIMDREVYVEIPPEDPTSEGGGRNIGRVNKSLYGTRDAAQKLGKQVCGFTHKLLFEQGRASTCIFPQGTE